MLWVVYLIYSFSCAYFSCKSNQPSEALKQTLHEHFGVDNKTELANYVLRFTVSSPLRIRQTSDYRTLMESSLWGAL